MATDFELLPAIDLRGGGVVRLEQGDFERETRFSDDPAAVATIFARAGAGWLHVVDLDGARAGRPVNAAAVEAIARAVGRTVRVEVAGGLRSADSVAAVLAGPVARAVVGTAALRDPAFAGRLVARHGADRIAVAIDVREGRAVGQAWSAHDAGVAVDEVMIRLAAVGVGTFEVTAIEQDGLLQGPDLALYERVVALGVGRIIASAGVASLAHLEAVRAVGCSGAIVGRALYDGTLDPAATVAAVRGWRSGDPATG